jgi:hypothetical protein
MRCEAGSCARRREAGSKVSRHCSVATRAPDLLNCMQTAGNTRSAVSPAAGPPYLADALAISARGAHDEGQPRVRVQPRVVCKQGSGGSNTQEMGGKEGKPGPPLLMLCMRQGVKP